MLNRRTVRATLANAENGGGHEFSGPEVGGDHGTNAIERMRRWWPGQMTGPQQRFAIENSNGRSCWGRFDRKAHQRAQNQQRGRIQKRTGCRCDSIRTLAIGPISPICPMTFPHAAAGDFHKRHPITPTTGSEQSRGHARLSGGGRCRRCGR